MSKELLGLMKKTQKKSDILYKKQLKDKEKIPDYCIKCMTRVKDESKCSKCVKDLTSKDCLFVEQSDAFKKLITYAMLGSMFTQGLK